jgi:hypothetical protein
MKKLFSKRRLKIVGIVFGALVLIYFVLFSPQLIDSFKAEKAARNYDKWEESIKEQYRNDTYGGDTPEETWAMFIEALENRNFDLAVKYFDLNEQEKWGSGLTKIIEERGIEIFLSELRTFRKGEKESIGEDKRYYFFSYFDKEFDRVLSAQVVFFFNPYSKVWKILGL